MSKADRIAILQDTLSKMSSEHYSTNSTIMDYTGCDLPTNPGSPIIEVTSEKTQDAILGCTDKTTILNFASGTRPGGGARNGVQAQEEDLCLCSDLLLHLEAHPSLYQSNRAPNAPPEYLDWMIVSPEITFIKDGQYQPTPPMQVSVITYPAPNTRIARCRPGTVLERRAVHIIDAAVAMSTDTLVLGAWGCGVFGNNPKSVALAFKKAISSHSGSIKKVIFAIYGNDNNFNAFRTVFGDGKDTGVNKGRK
ncbi:MAG: hypothetical protein UY48_C0042G0010 [Candidatus Gottesmanbacteria bacterium GW2011_GWB1_49_7]|uniref:Microbial-type PARG catalytic domain-containing protein n=1 Tax=Candidatus Gottesmanbacteria bacterium GW2011_GWB1_49_7 TaxID=1618448 RepID=A0A0G1VUW6_9BACT|nr:MAG: hypothetical protein UY48_C0042G0010 [Candidatus Gottesmanbacteria bacterium GW2011_GWB1_49_7]